MSNATVFLLTLSPTIEESEDDIEIFPIVDYELCSAHWAVIVLHHPGNYAGVSIIVD
jgi:hypothetical protein